MSRIPGHAFGRIHDGPWRCDCGKQYASATTDPARREHARHLATLTTETNPTNCAVCGRRIIGPFVTIRRLRYCLKCSEV